MLVDLMMVEHLLHNTPRKFMRLLENRNAGLTIHKGLQNSSNKLAKDLHAILQLN